MDSSDLYGLRLTDLDAAGGAAVVESILNTLPQFMQQQQESNWCWSAAGTSVGLFYQTGTWTQCDTANACLEASDCCTTPSNCNVYGYVNKALTYTLSFNSWYAGTYTAQEMQAQIDFGRPLCVRVAWYGGGAHFLAMTGYSYPTSDPSSVTVYLQDSIYGASAMPFTDFASQYNGGGTWTDTYLTMPNS